jgi:pilus assembly protein CpaB
MSTTTRKSSLIDKAKSPWALLAVALAIAAGIATLTFNYLESRERRIQETAEAQAAGKRAPEVSVVVPVGDAGIGTVVSPQTFAARSIPQDLVYEDTIKASDFEFFAGQKLAKPLQRGRPLRISDLIAPEVRDVAAVVPAGKRAVTIAIDNLNSIAQTVRPGNLLDIFLISRAPKLDEKMPDEGLDQATLFMQGMEVLAVGRDFNDPRLHPDLKKNMARPGDLPDADARNYDTVTLLVSPAQAAKLMVGQKMGAYRVALRGRDDDSPLKLAALKASDFMPSLPKNRDQGIEFIVGGSGGGANLVSVRPVAASVGAPPPTPVTPIDPMNAQALEKALMNMAATNAVSKTEHGGLSASGSISSP